MIIYDVLNLKILLVAMEVLLRGLAFTGYVAFTFLTLNPKDRTSGFCGK